VPGNWHAGFGKRLTEKGLGVPRWLPTSLDEARPGEALPTRAAYSTLDETVTATFVLPGEPQDQLVQLAGTRSPASRSSPVGSQLAPDQLSVPAEQRVRAGQQGLPIRPRQGAADGGQEETICGLPARAADLSLQHMKLMPEGQDLGLEPGPGATADDQDLQQEVNDRVEEGEEHGRGSSHSAQWLLGARPGP